MDNDDLIGKLIDAKTAFKLRQLNQERAKEGLEPLTMEDLIRGEQLMKGEEVITPSSVNTPKPLTQSSKIQKPVKKPNVIQGDFTPKSSEPNVRSTEATLHDLGGQRLKKESKQAQELMDEFFERQYLPNDVLREDAAFNLKDIKENAKIHGAKIPVEYADFRTPLEKGLDEIKFGAKSIAKDLGPSELKKTYNFAKDEFLPVLTEDLPKTAGKVLQYAAPPLAAYDLFWNKPRESVEEIKRKGLAQELSEIGLDAAALGAPAARMAGRAALAAGLDIAALPLGGYLLGKEVDKLMGGPREPWTPEEPKDYDTTTPTVIAPDQPLSVFNPGQDLRFYPDAEKMPNYEKIKKLLK